MKLATIEQIKNVRVHPNADRLELIDILGYQLVCEKGIHTTGDVVVFIQPDTVLPELEWAETYRKYSPKRVKAVKLRNEWSEGIVVRWDQLQGIMAEGLFFRSKETPDMVLRPGDIREPTTQYIGLEIAQLLDVKKYEAPMPQDISAKRLLPFNIPKTDQERWENLNDIPYRARCDVSLKIDGQSWSAYYNIDTKEFGVTGRTFEFKDDVINNFTKHIERYSFKDKLIELCENLGLSLCIRGESYGPGIQSSGLNPHSKGEYGLALYDVFIISERRYARYGEDLYFTKVAGELELPTVPILQYDVELSQDLIDHYAIGIKKIDGKFFEGVVIKYDGGSFKVINKHYDANK
jgi:RNA ligase (TIGR02306 family)